MCINMNLNSFSAPMPLVKLKGYNPKTKTDEVELLEDFGFFSLRTGKLYIAKVGFIFDGASIPKWAWSLIGHPLSSFYIRSALIHDLLYVAELESREICDLIFRDMLEADRVKRWKINPMYAAVYVGGGFVWDDHERKNVINYRSEFAEVKIYEKVN